MTTVWTVVKRGIGVVTTGLLCAALAACGSDGGTTTVNVNPPDPDVRVDSRSLGVSPDGERLAASCGGLGDKICVWDTSDGAIIDRFAGGEIVAWSPDGSVIATNDGDANVVLMDADTGKEVATLAGHELGEDTDIRHGILHLAFSLDGNMLASSAEDGTVRIWSVPDGEQHRELDTGSDGIRSPSDLAFSADGSRLAVTDNLSLPENNDTAQLWDVETGERVTESAGSAPAGQHVAFSPDGRWLATAGEMRDASVVVCDADSRDVEQSFDREVNVFDMVFSPDGTLLAFNDREDKEIVLWPVGDGDPRVLSDGIEDFPKSLRFSPDGEFVYSISGKGGIVKWRVDDGERLEDFELPESSVPPSPE